MQQRIGEFMVSIKAMSESQVADVLRAQHDGDSRRFGDIALEKGYLVDDNLKRYLDYLEETATGDDVPLSNASSAERRRASQDIPFASALVPVLVYLILSIAYILISGRIAAAHVSTVGQLESYEAIKGVAFVLVTGVILLGALLGVRRLARRDRRLLINTERRATASVYSATLAHDLRNLLVGLSSLINDIKPYGEKDPRLAEITQAVEDSVRSISDFADQIASSARQMQSGINQDVDLAKDVARITSLAKHHPALRACRFSVGDIPEISVRINAELFEQAVLNLIINAAHAAGHGGKVELETRPTPGAITLAVHDSGPGIAAKDLKMIWEPGYTTKSEGSGLGLVSVRAFAASCNAELSVGRSHLGGAVFRLAIPIGMARWSGEARGGDDRSDR